MRILFALLFVAALTGCQVTVLENLPAGATADCPAEWRGGFVGVDRDTNENAAFGVFVDEQCAFSIYDREKDRKAALVSVSPRYLRNVLLVSSEDVAKVAAAKSDSSDPAPTGWQPFRWNRSGELLQIDPPDHRRIATLIVNGAIDGETRWSNESGSNLIRGDAQAQLEFLTKHRLFGDAPPITLRHVATTRAKLERALDKAHRP